MSIAKHRLESGAKYPFDGGKKAAKDWAHAAARGVLADLTDRRGVKQELNEIDSDIRKELVATVADIIREAYAQSNPTV